MAETVESLAAAIEEKRQARPERPEPFVFGSEEVAAYYQRLETWARELDSLQAQHTGLANRMVFQRTPPRAAHFTHAPRRLRQ